MVASAAPANVGPVSSGAASRAAANSLGVIKFLLCRRNGQAEAATPIDAELIRRAAVAPGSWRGVLARPHDPAIARPGDASQTNLDQARTPPANLVKSDHPGRPDACHAITETRSTGC